MKNTTAKMYSVVENCFSKVELWSLNKFTEGKKGEWKMGSLGFGPFEADPVSSTTTVVLSSSTGDSLGASSITLPSCRSDDAIRLPESSLTGVSNVVFGQRKTVKSEEIRTGAAR